MMHTVNTLPIHSTSNSSNSSNIKRKKCNRSSEHTGNEKKIAENWNHLTLNEPVYLFHLKNSLFFYQTRSKRQQYFVGILLLHHKISLLFELWCNPLLIVDLLQLNHVERSSTHTLTFLLLSHFQFVSFFVSLSPVLTYSKSTFHDDLNETKKNERLLQSKHGVYCLF